MLTFPLAIFLLTAPPSPSASPERVAARIVEAFRTEDITKLRDDANLEDSFPWYDIKEQLDRTRCITINDHQEILESADDTRARVVIIINATSHVRGASNRAVDFPPFWNVVLDKHAGRWRIISARTEEHELALRLLEAPDDERDAFLDSLRKSRPVILKTADLLSARPLARAQNESLAAYLEQRCARAGDLEGEAYV